jgi:hypothetical protein
MNVKEGDIRAEVSAVQTGVRMRARAGHRGDRAVAIGQSLREHVAGEPLQLSRIVGALFHDLMAGDIDQRACEILREFFSHGAVVDVGIAVVLAAIAAAVPVRLMKRDLLFVTERLAGLVDERRLDIVARQRSIKREKDSDSIAKLFAAYLRRADEGALGSVLVELTILLTAARQQTTQVLNDAAAVYKVDTEAIAAKVKQEFAAKDKAKSSKKAAPKPPARQQAKTAKKSAAA